MKIKGPGLLPRFQPVIGPKGDTIDTESRQSRLLTHRVLEVLQATTMRD